MKKSTLFATALLTCGFIFFLPVLAEETTETEVIAAEETAEKTAQDLFWLSSIYGEYYGIAYQESDAFEMRNDKFVILPNNIAVYDSVELPYTYDGTTFTFDTTAITKGLEELGVELKEFTMTGTFGEMLPVEDSFTFLFCDEESPALYITVSATQVDSSDPLNVKDITETTVNQLCLMCDQRDFMDSVLTSYAWKLGDNTISFGEDDKLSLNNGEKTGNYSIGYDSTVRFNWDEGATVDYSVTGMTEDGVTLTNVDDDSNVLEFKIQGVAAEETPAETESEVESELESEA